MLKNSPDCFTCLFSWYGLPIMVGGVGYIQIGPQVFGSIYQHFAFCKRLLPVLTVFVVKNAGAVQYRSNVKCCL